MIYRDALKIINSLFNFQYSHFNKNVCLSDRNLQIPKHNWLALRSLRVQRAAPHSRGLHGLGDQTRQDICPERLQVHRHQCLFRRHHEYQCGGDWNHHLRAGNTGLHYDYKLDLDNDYFYAMLAVLAENHRD